MGSIATEAKSIALFEGKAAVIFGATHKVAQYIVRGLAHRGAFVVAVDEDDRMLFKLAATNPSKIETLTAAPGSEDFIDRLAGVWGDQPLDYLIAAPEADMMDAQFRRSLERLMDRFGPILNRSGGRALCLFDTVEEKLPMRSQAWGVGEANAAFIRDMGMRDGCVINALSLQMTTPPAMAAARAIAMLSPIMSGISGAMMPVAAPPQRPH